MRISLLIGAAAAIVLGYFAGHRDPDTLHKIAEGVIRDAFNGIIQGRPSSSRLQ